MLAAAKAGAGDFESHQRTLRQLVTLGKASAGTYNNLAWHALFLGAGSARQTLEDAERAATLTKNERPSVLNTLASVYAEAGRATEAHELLVKYLGVIDERAEPQPLRLVRARARRGGPRPARHRTPRLPEGARGQAGPAAPCAWPPAPGGAGHGRDDARRVAGGPRAPLGRSPGRAGPPRLPAPASTAVPLRDGGSRREPEVRGLEVLRHLLGLRGPHDGAGHALLAQRPGERERAAAHAERVREGLEAAHLLQVLLGEQARGEAVLAGEPRARGRSVSYLPVSTPMPAGSTPRGPCRGARVTGEHLLLDALARRAGVLRLLDDGGVQAVGARRAAPPRRSARRSTRWCPSRGSCPGRTRSSMARARSPRAAVSAS